MSFKASPDPATSHLSKYRVKKCARMKSTSMERPTKAKPMTLPARNAVLKASVHGLLPAAITVVRALENTATFMPIHPESIDVKPPATKETQVNPPSSMWNSPPV